MGYVYRGDNNKIDPTRIKNYDNNQDCRWEITVSPQTLSWNKVDEDLNFIWNIDQRYGDLDNIYFITTRSRNQTVD